jgi:hypothetical protein
MMIYFVIITLLQQLIPSQTPEQFSKLPCSTAVPLQIVIFSINLVFLVTLRSSGTDILYDCHLETLTHFHLLIAMFKFVMVQPWNMGVC